MKKRTDPRTSRRARRTHAHCLSCPEFVTEIVAAAVAARRFPALAERRRALARALVRRFVPAARILGVDLRRVILGAAVRTRIAALTPGQVAGFRRELTAGGQGAEALRHIAAGAACHLMRRDFLRVAANVIDHLQGVLRRRPREASAEVMGNNTGARVGRRLETYLRRQCSRRDLEKKLRSLLCARPQPRRARPPDQA